MSHAIPAHGRLKQRGLQIQDQPGVQSNILSQNKTKIKNLNRHFSKKTYEFPTDKWESVQQH
jgi:ribosomal protein S12